MDSIEETSQEFYFERHSDSVLCCDIDPVNKLVITGGVDDKAFVFNYKSKELLFECAGHKESVNSVKFNCTLELVASGDLSGIVHVRSLPKGNIIADYYVEEITWLKWHKTYSFVLFAGTISGDIWMWNIKDPSAVKVFPSSGFSSVSGELSDDGLQLISAYSNGSVKVFNLKSKKVVSQIDDSKQREIISLAACPGRTLFAVGYVDSTIKVVSSVACKLIATLNCKTPEIVLEGEIDETARKEVEVVDERDNEPGRPTGCNGDITDLNINYEANDDDDDEEGDIHEHEDADDEDDSAPKESIESLVFSACANYLIAANISGTICIWDTSNFNLRYEKHIAKRISKCILSQDGKLITSGLDGFIRMYDLTLNELLTIQAHQDQILDIACKSDTLVCCSDDNTCFVKVL